MPDRWDPETYLRYDDERSRPFVDLLARVGATDPADVVDLGCGPGSTTRLLHDRWPRATVRGLDTSPAMVERARRAGVDATVGDLRTWTPTRPVDVLVTTATLQWVPGHLEHLPRLLDQVAPGGWFAMTVPGNFAEPSHALRRELAAQKPYAAHLAEAPEPTAHDAATYAGVLRAAGWSVDAWETTYLHVLTGPDPVWTWISGTSARPAMAALPDGLREQFVADLRDRLARAYPPRPAPGTGEPEVVLPFRRVFAVARRP